MNLSKKPYKKVLHVLSWGLFALFNYLLSKGNGMEFDLLHQLKLYAIYIFVFYGFYFYIIPLLFKKKTILFIFLSLALLSGSVYLKNTIQQNYFMARFSEKEYEYKNDFKPPVFKGDRPQVLKFPPHPNRGTIIIDGFSILLFILISISLRFAEKWQLDEKSRYILQKEKTDAELQFLKQQINPHFIFNSLNSIYSLANKKSDLTSDAILKLSSILRYVLYHSQKNLISLKEELNTIEDYIELQRLRITNKVSLNYALNGQPENYLIEPLLLMPLFENAFKYGVDSINESFISMEIQISEDRLTLQINNKIIPRNDKIEEESGIGLNNIIRRLEILYPDSHLLSVDESESVFKVKLELKLKK
jgi:two-component system, LytTR family, sensor kinase